MSYHAFFFCVHLNTEDTRRQTQEKLKGGDKISSKQFSTSALSLTNGQSEMFHIGCVVFVPFGLRSRLLILAVVMEAYKVFSQTQFRACFQCFLFVGHFIFAPAFVMFRINLCGDVCSNLRVGISVECKQSYIMYLQCPRWMRAVITLV